MLRLPGGTRGGRSAAQFSGDNRGFTTSARRADRRAVTYHATGANILVRVDPLRSRQSWLFRNKMPDTFNARRQPALYWKQMVQLKAAAICIRLYGNQLTHRIRAVELVKVIGSGGGIAGWVVWRDLPFL